MRKFVVSLLLLGSLAACGGVSYTEDQQKTDLMNDGRSLGLNPTAVIVEAGSTKSKKVWDKKKKQWVRKSSTSKTEVEMAFTINGCRFEADRALNAGGDPNKVEGFTVEIEDSGEEFDFDEFGAFNRQQVIDMTNAVPAGYRPSCWKS